MAIVETLVGAAAGAVLGAAGSWFVSRSERRKAEEAAERARKDATTAFLAAELAQKLGSMLSPYTADSITPRDVAKMRLEWEAYAQSLRLRGFNGRFEDLNSAIVHYVDALGEFVSGKTQRGRVEQRRDHAVTTARQLIVPRAA